MKFEKNYPKLIQSLPKIFQYKELDYSVHTQLQKIWQFCEELFNYQTSIFNLLEVLTYLIYNGGNEKKIQLIKKTKFLTLISLHTKISPQILLSPFYQFLFQSYIDVINNKFKQLTKKHSFNYPVLTRRKKQSTSLSAGLSCTRSIVVKNQIDAENIDLTKTSFLKSMETYGLFLCEINLNKHSADAIQKNNFKYKCMFNNQKYNQHETSMIQLLTHRITHLMQSDIHSVSKETWVPFNQNSTNNNNNNAITMDRTLFNREILNKTFLLYKQLRKTNPILLQNSQKNSKKRKPITTKIKKEKKPRITRKKNKKKTDQLPQNDENGTNQPTQNDENGTNQPTQKKSKEKKLRQTKKTKKNENKAE